MRFLEDVSKGEYEMGHVGHINKHRHGSCEWYIVNEKQPKLALANYVMTVGESPPSLPKLYFLSYVLKKGT